MYRRRIIHAGRQPRVLSRRCCYRRSYYVSTSLPAAVVAPVSPPVRGHSRYSYQQSLFHSSPPAFAGESEADVDPPAEGKESSTEAPPVTATDNTEDNAEPIQYSTPELTKDAALHKKLLNDPDRPDWQNPLHHANPDDRIFEEDFESKEEFEKHVVPAPPVGDHPIPDYIDALADEIVHLTVLEMNELTNKMGQHYGFADGQLTAGALSDSASGGGEEAEEQKEEKTAFDVKLTAFDAKSKIKIIKEVRSMAGLGLKEAKEWVENVPTVVQKDVKMPEAEDIKAKLEELGATVEIV